MKRVKVFGLKAYLSEYLRRVHKGRGLLQALLNVRRGLGHTVEVLDREAPVARLAPLEERSSGLTVRPAVGRFRDLKLPRRRWRIHADVVALIREDRDAR